MAEITSEAAHGGGRVVLTIDVGTSSVRAMLFDEAGDPIPGLEAQRVHQMRSTADGGVETDAPSLFGRVAACIDDVLAQAGDRAASIVAVAPTTFWHSLLGVSAKGEPLTPVFTWADTRASSAAEALKHELDPEAIHARTGCVIHATYWPAKLRWLQTDRAWKRTAARAARWLSFAEFMTLRLFGTPRCSISMASGTGLLDQHTCAWHETLLHSVPVKAATLSPVDDAPCHGLLPEFAGRWPSLAHVPWFPGWGDGATSNVGSGCVGKQHIAMMIGTSAAMRAVWRTKRVTIVPELWCYRVDSSRVVVGGALSNGGNLIDWLRATLRIPDEQAALEAALGDMRPDQSGITVLPFLAGERSTGWHSEARATFSGLSLHTSSLEIYRAGHEAIAYRFGQLYRLLRREVRGSKQVIASGGAILHSPAWLQMMADVLDTPVIASAVAEASSRGAALLGLEALGVLPDVAKVAAPLGQVFRPDPGRVRIYRHGLERQEALYRTLIGDPEGPRTHDVPAVASNRPLPVPRN